MLGHKEVGCGTSVEWRGLESCINFEKENIMRKHKLLGKLKSLYNRIRGPLTKISLINITIQIVNIKKG